MIRHSIIRAVFFSLLSAFIFSSAGAAWTDDPLQPSTLVKAAHVTELQAAVLAKEGACGIAGSPPFTPVAPGDVIAMSDAQTIKMRITGLYTAKGAPVPPMGNTLYPGSPVRAADISAMRSAIDNFDTALLCPPSACTSAADCNDGNVCTVDDCVSSVCQHVNQPVDAVMSDWGACQADCTHTRTVVTPASCGGSTGPLSEACSGGACIGPSCWDCFDSAGTGSGSYCYSNGDQVQTNACIQACTSQIPPLNAAQVPLSYCAVGACLPVSARVANDGGPSGICNAYCDTYYVSPNPGLQGGNTVYYDAACQSMATEMFVADCGGQIYSMNSGVIGAPTGNAC